MMLEQIGQYAKCVLPYSKCRGFANEPTNWGTKFNRIVCCLFRLSNSVLWFGLEKKRYHSGYLNTKKKQLKKLLYENETNNQIQWYKTPKCMRSKMEIRKYLKSWKPKWETKEFCFVLFRVFATIYRKHIQNKSECVRMMRR